MWFNRFAPAITLILAIIFWMFPWVEDVSGFRIWKSVFEEGRGAKDPLIITIQVLLVAYPLALFLGTVSALASLASRWRAAFVGVSAFVPLITLTGVYLFLLIMDRNGLRDLTAWFFLSHAATLVCVILCVREYKRATPPV
jgi:hypothetical protein